MTFEEYQLQEHNYKCITTFWHDFSIADRLGSSAINDTFKRAFNEWRSDYRYLTELVIVLNHKCWYWYEKNNKYSQLYADLYYKANDYANKNLKDDEYQYFFDITD